VDRRLTALPEADIRRASPGAAFIILTHDHALDFLLTAEALARPDAAYIGMIGSHTKRKKFERFCATQAPATATDRLICPIGATVSTDKRPAIIAAFVAAEVMTQLTKTPSQQRTLTT
ncbi:XdhC family protein, partial [Yoonia sp. MH D7]